MFEGDVEIEDRGNEVVMSGDPCVECPRGHPLLLPRIHGNGSVWGKLLGSNLLVLGNKRSCAR